MHGHSMLGAGQAVQAEAREGEAPAEPEVPEPLSHKAFSAGLRLGGSLALPVRIAKPVLHLLGLLAFLFSVPLLAQEPARVAREKLVGVWLGYAVEGKGENPDQGAVKLELTISKDLIKARQFKGKQPSDLGEGTFAIMLDQTPNNLDGDKKLDNPNRKEKWLGIYQLDGDTLKWCVGRKTRPTAFQTKQGAFLLILKRQSK